jgi:hypothetical protein
MMNTSMPNSTTWNVKRRREFSQLKPGTELPGYRGYIEQYKYHVGDTYGNATNKLSEAWRTRHPAYTASPQNYFDPKTTFVGTGLSGPEDVEGSGTKRDLKLPKSTGDNKLTEKMVPGYTGYIPRMPFKFGNTYKEDCDVCIDDFMRNTKEHDTKVHTLRKAQTQIKPLRPMADEGAVINRLNQYRDRHPTSKILLEDKRASREAPIPGYNGFIPRQGVSELGLGARYHTICDKSFNTFYDETEAHAERIGRAYTPKTMLPDDQAKASIQLTKENRDVLMQRRLYKQIGMVPKYTGYLPQIRFQFGHTYGDTTRSLPVCFHEQPTYGQHLSTVQQSV